MANANAGKLSYSKMDVARVSAAIEKHELVGVPAGATIQQQADRLDAYFLKSVPDKDRVRCDECGGWSSADESCCPFCGDGDEEAEAKPKGGKSAAVVVSDKASPDQLKKLDQEVRDIRALYAGADAASWLLGKRLGELHD